MQTTTLTQQELYITMRSMEVHGGGFCRALAQAWYAADRGNRHRIEQAFPHLLIDFGPTSPFYEQ
jgi:hypothetical protein